MSCRTIGSQQPEDGAGLYLQANIAEGPVAGILLHYVANADHCLHGYSCKVTKVSAIGTQS